MGRSYDWAIVGAGSAGLAAASFLVKVGQRVALVDNDRIGGDCTWTGCVPSKALLHAAEVAHHLRTAERVGLESRPVRADLKRVMATVRAARQRVYALETPEMLRDEGVDVHLGPTAFRDPHTLEVAGEALAARRFLLCTGASPSVPSTPGLAEGPYLTNQNVFDELEELPERLVVLGGGPVGAELAQAFGRLGSRVTLVGRNQRLLPPADPEASALLLKAFAEEGIAVHPGAEVERVERRGATATVVAGGRRHEADAILVALGRRPRVDGLALERAGVQYDERRIVVDDFLRTTQPHIWAAGDAVGSFQFTHYAGWQAVMAARNALFPGHTKAILPSVPWAIFTDPEVAQVGSTEGEARARGQPVEVVRLPVERNDRAQTADEQNGLVKLVLRPDGAIVGATIVGAAAGELINEVTLAMDNRLKLGDLVKTMHAYPTYGFALQMAAADRFRASLSEGLKGRVVRALTRLKR